MIESIESIQNVCFRDKHSKSQSSVRRFVCECLLEPQEALKKQRI